MSEKLLTGNEPAFPQKGYTYKGADGKAVSVPECDGMTLLQKFSESAMKALLSSGIIEKRFDVDEIQRLASISILCAKCLITELSKEQKKQTND